MNFFIIFPFINIKLQGSSQIYQQYLCLRKIVNFVMDVKVRVDELKQFDEDVEEYLRLTRLNNIPFTLKTHHLTHYSMLMKEYGPLIYYSTLRFERYHQVGKNAIESSRNRRNLAKSIATAYSYKIDKTCSPSVEILIKKNNISEKIDTEFLPFIDQNSDILLLESTVLDKIKVKTKNYYVYKKNNEFEYNYPIFFYVDLIIKQSNITKVLGFLVDVECFDRNKYSFKLKDSDIVKVLDLGKLPHYKKLNYISINDHDEYICKDFHIDYDSLCYQV